MKKVVSITFTGFQIHGHKKRLMFQLNIRHFYFKSG
jgi:hypothetical protein